MATRGPRLWAQGDKGPKALDRRLKGVYFCAVNIDTATIRKLAEALLQSGQRPATVVSSAYATLMQQGLLGDAEKAALTRVDPVAETMFLMMAADGDLKADERVAIRGAIRGLTAELLADGIIDVMLENYRALLTNEGREQRLQQIAGALAYDVQSAEGAFALAAAVALADRHVDPAELELISRLAEWFGISAARATSILDQIDYTPAQSRGCQDLPSGLGFPA
ncbi:MAG TPA: TerB family tellurite resistance protein [Polyangiaceae bacterium]|nr:TerB family tellurite resistance protein [Polyangiaceae bacterium]